MDRNQNLRAARDSLGLGQVEFAAAINRAGRVAGETLRCDARQVAKWEAGAVAWPQTRYRRALESVTGISCPGLGFGRSAPDDDLEDPVQRRELLGLGTAAALGAIPIPNLGRRLPSGYLDEVHQTLERLQGLERRFGSRPLLTMIETQANELKELLDDGADSPGLLTAASWAHMLAGWFSFDARQHDRARGHYREALYTAQLAGDRPMVARTAAVMSMHAARLGRPAHAVRLARMGAEHLPKRGRAAALLAIREARGWGLAGRPVEARAAVQRAMDAHSSGPVLPWSTFFGEGEVSGGAAWVARDLEHWAEAEALASRAVADADMPPRARASFALCRAESIARSGDTDGAVEATAGVMSEIEHLESERVREQAAQVAAILPGDDPRVAGWREQLAATA